MSTTIYATFNDVAASERAAGALLDYGVKNEDLSIVRSAGENYDPNAPMTTGVIETDVNNTTPIESDVVTETKYEPGYQPGMSRADETNYDNLSNREAPKAHDPEGVAKSGITPTTGADAGAGAIKGAGVGLGVGALAALASIFVPGFGLVAGGGALAIAITGAAAATGAGAIAGGVTGYLKDQGIDSHVAEQYGKAVGEGGGLIGVRVPSGDIDESTVRSVLEKYGAINITDYAGTGSGGYVA